MDNAQVSHDGAHEHWIHLRLAVMLRAARQLARNVRNRRRPAYAIGISVRKTHCCRLASRTIYSSGAGTARRPIGAIGS